MPGFDASVMPLPSISGADPWTLELGVSDMKGGTVSLRDSRFAHHEVVTSVNGGDEAERSN